MGNWMMWRFCQGEASSLHPDFLICFVFVYFLGSEPGFSQVSVLGDGDGSSTLSLQFMRFSGSRFVGLHSKRKLNVQIKRFS